MGSIFVHELTHVVKDICDTNDCSQNREPTYTGPTVDFVNTIRSEEVFPEGIRMFRIQANGEETTIGSVLKTPKMEGSIMLNCILLQDSIVSQRFYSLAQF